MSTYQIWQHKRSGECYAVALSAIGAVKWASGPLHHSEHAAALEGDWDNDQELADDLSVTDGDYVIANEN